MNRLLPLIGALVVASLACDPTRAESEVATTAVTATLDGTVQTGASLATVPLPAGYTLAGCHLDACCNQ